MENNAKAKRFLIATVALLLGTLLGIFLLFLIFDPYFHFHGPIRGISYRLYEERYINDGISRHFDYDMMITGTSMAQNFKPSEADALFGKKTVKETFSGAGFQEISENIERALRRNPKLDTVLWSFEYNGFFRPYDWTNYDNYPTYLYDDNPFNDVSYVYNKGIFYHGLVTNMVMNLTGEKSTTMDEYSFWDKETGLEHILDLYDRNDLWTDVPAELYDEEREEVRENIQKNMVDLFNKYPDTTFYLFYTPYSIVFWDSLDQMNCMERQFQAEQMTTEMLLQCPNVKLYNFFDQYDVITNTDNYRDKEHYGAHINSQILKWISEGEGLLTEQNYLERLQEERLFYQNYYYDGIFEGVN